MENEWYDTGNWYDPLTNEKYDVALIATKQAPKRANSKIRIWGLISLLIVLVIATSVLFSDGDRSFSRNNPSVNADNELESYPDSFKDFFSAFYTKIESDVSEINIELYGFKSDFRLELEPVHSGVFTLQEIYRNCSPSIVGISGYKNNTSGYSWGTGIILSSDGIILTNTHVIEGCDCAKVTLADNSEFDATLVGADSISDLAVLKIETNGLTPAEFGVSSEVYVGDSVAAIGNPLGETFRLTLTNGIISAIERGVSYNGRTMALLQTNTALNEGNSGGALFNMYGQVIGITNMKMMSTYSSIEGIGFAIPASTVETVVNSIMEYGVVKGRTSIGITVGAIPENVAGHYNLPSGLYVSDVIQSSDAYAKGIRVGDIITAANGVPVKSTSDILSIKDKLQVGDTICFTVWRENITVDIEVALMDTLDLY